MQTNLIEAINAWEQLIDDNIDTYNALIVQYLELNDHGTIDEPGSNPGLYILETQLINLQTQYEGLEIALKAAIEAGTGVAEAQAALIAKENEIIAKQAEITTKESEIDAVLQQISDINDLLDINNADNFTKGQQLRLSKFTYENTYQNENIIVTDIFTPAQIQETKIELYNQAQEVLSRTSVPHYEFKMEAINFIHLPEFARFTQQIPLTLGVEAIINTDNMSVTAVLLELEYNLEDPSDFSMTFSNRLRLDNATFQYTDLMGHVVKTGTSVSFQKGNWSNWTREYKSNVSTFITSSLDATRNSILASQGQEMTINGAGLRGKQLINPLDESGGYKPEQVWLTGNTLGFTDDNWSTLKTAIGRIDLGGGTYGYGLVGDYLIGNMIVGANLTIETDSNLNSSFVVDSNGVSMTNMNLFAYGTSGESFVQIDPTDPLNIFKIGRKVGSALTTNFSVNNQGTITMKGNLLIIKIMVNLVLAVLHLKDYIMIHLMEK
jgi:hypothetical protein